MVGPLVEIHEIHDATTASGEAALFGRLEIADGRLSEIDASPATYMQRRGLLEVDKASCSGAYKRAT